MQFCVINNSKFHKSGTRQTLLGLETVTTKQFQGASGIETGGWMKKCPYPGCGHDLRVSLTDEETEEYSAWCEECGWTPSDGFFPESKYRTIQEAAAEMGIPETTMRTLVKSGWIGAVNFSKHKYPEWRIPVRLIRSILSSDGDWTLYTGIATI